jgi:hypothetical protein
MGKRKLPLPPGRGKANTSESGAGEKSPTPSHVPPHLAAMARHHARLVNLDTGTHVDSRGVEHTTHPGNKPQVGPLTIIFASKMGHPPMRFGDHAKLKTNVHTHMMGKAAPHPNAIAAKIAHRMRLPKPPAAAPEGSPSEEAAETPAEEAAEQPEKPVKRAKRLPLPPGKVA